MRRSGGFTLIELMIVVVVVAILASIALPSYQEYVRKGRRAEASQGIGAIQMAQERWRAEHSTYGTFAEIGSPASSAYYTFTVTGNTATSYTATATRKAGTGQANDRCGNLSVVRDAKPSWSPGGDGCN